MEAAKWSVTSLIYCLMFGLIFWASLLVYFLSAQSGQEVYSEDWLQQYLRRCFSPILSLVLTVFRVTAGNYRLTRLRPNIHSFSLCLSFLILGTKLFLDFSDKLCSFKMSAHLRYKANGSVWFQQCTMTENIFSLSPFFFFFFSWHHEKDDESYHEIHTLNTTKSMAPMQYVFCMQGLRLLPKLDSVLLPHNLTGVNFKEVNEENKQKLFGEIYTAIDTLAFTFGNV